MHVPCNGGLLRELGRGLCLGLSRQGASTAGQPSSQSSPADRRGHSERVRRPASRQEASPVGRCYPGPGPQACLSCGHELLRATASLPCWHWARWGSSLTGRLPAAWGFRDPPDLGTRAPGRLCWLHVLMHPQGLVFDWRLCRETNGC